MSYNGGDQRVLQEIFHYLDMGRFEQAGKKLEQMLADSPNDGHLLYLMAICLYESDRNEEALASCTEALNNGFSVERCNLLLGRIYVGLKKYVEAEECFLTALRVNPRNAEAIATYGFLMLKTGHDRKAAQLMDEALRLDPDNETVLHYNFYRHLAADKRDEQLQILKRYLQTSDSEVRKLVKIGLSDWFRNDYKSARENFRQAYLLDPTNVDILSILQEVTRQSHILFLPHRLVAKIGGPVVLWMIFITLTVILVRLNLDSVTIAVMLIYLLYVIYSWMAPIVYKILVK